MSARNGQVFCPSLPGGRTQTMTIRVTREQAAGVDYHAALNGLSRANFLRLCVNAGHMALVSRGVMQ